MVQQVVGVKTNNIYFTGDAIACRRFINDNQEAKHVASGKKFKKSNYNVLKEAMRIA